MVHYITTHECALGYTGITEQPKERRWIARLPQHISAIPVRPQRQQQRQIYQWLRSGFLVRLDHQSDPRACVAILTTPQLFQNLTENNQGRGFLLDRLVRKHQKISDGVLRYESCTIGVGQRSSHGGHMHGLHIRPSAKEGCSSIYPQKLVYALNV